MGSAVNYNPDILSCLANLSNDEVFTPPELVNRILDMLPSELWSNPNTRVLDPCSKSGVFLREIAKRMIEAEKDSIPDLQERIDHIFHKQLYGIAITELTSLLSRRSLYCSKTANGQYSVSEFKTPGGNIIYRKRQHTWDGDKCIYCGVSKNGYDRPADLESYAYEFIHLTDKEFKELSDMHFDLIIGNPPYQLSDGGGVGSSALPIYDRFVTQAKKLQPKEMIMIIPSRWFSGGRGLDEFRNEMLHDDRLKEIHDFPDASDCFPGVEIKGGICYFLWDRDNHSDCKVVSHSKGKIVSESIRPLLEEGMDTFIRNDKMISILHKVQALKEPSFSTLISANDPFGFDVREKNSYKRVKPNFEIKKKPGTVPFYYNGWRKNGVGYIDRDSIRKGKNLLDCKKLFIPKAWGSGDPSTDWLNPIAPMDEACCTETYLVVGPFKSSIEMENVQSYIDTKFFHLMVSFIKITQNTMQRAYSLVPIQDFSKPWTDEELYKKYDLSNDEIAFIESIIRPMDLSNDKEGGSV